MRSVLVITLICIFILLAFSQVWVPKVMGWDQNVITDSGTVLTLQPLDDAAWIRVNLP
ncbi:MAG TPA: hypothetical protein VD840_04470 [Sinorhizobium sp.]|nr:hypothetical protein [Sinorhizobium sp.]